MTHDQFIKYITVLYISTILFFCQLTANLQLLHVVSQYYIQCTFTLTQKLSFLFFHTQRLTKEIAGKDLTVQLHK